MRSAVRVVGYSDSSIDLLLQAHKFSTTRQYQTAWRVFLNFLESRGLSSKDVSLPVVCDFLTDLVITLDREYRTIAVYKCALRHPILYACRLDIHEDISILFIVLSEVEVQYKKFCKASKARPSTEPNFVSSL